jgi:hypothetical protein
LVVVRLLEHRGRVTQQLTLRVERQRRHDERCAGAKRDSLRIRQAMDTTVPLSRRVMVVSREAHPQDFRKTARNIARAAPDGRH